MCYLFLLTQLFGQESFIGVSFQRGIRPAGVILIFSRVIVIGQRKIKFQFWNTNLLKKFEKNFILRIGRLEG